MAVLGMRIKVWLIVVVMAAGLLALGTLVDSWNNNGGDRRITVDTLTHKGGHKRPPGCDKVKGKYKNKPSKKCRNHNGQPPPGQTKPKNPKSNKP
jgi:hypothetical protein